MMYQDNFRYCGSKYKDWWQVKLILLRTALLEDLCPDRIRQADNCHQLHHVSQHHLPVTSFVDPALVDSWLRLRQYRCLSTNLPQRPDSASLHVLL